MVKLNRARRIFLEMVDDQNSDCINYSKEVKRWASDFNLVDEVGGKFSLTKLGKKTLSESRKQDKHRPRYDI